MTDAADRDPRTHKERMLAGDPYIADDPVPVPAEDSQRAMALLGRFNGCIAEPVQRRTLLAELLGELGLDTDIRPPLLYVARLM